QRPVVEEGLEGALRRLLVADVELDEAPLAARRGDEGERLLGLLLLGAVVDEDLEAVLGERESAGAADPARGSGDEGEAFHLAGDLTGSKRSSGLSGRAAEEPLDRRDDALGRHAELAEDDLSRRGGAEAIDPERDAAAAEEALPAERRRGLDRDTRGDAREEHRLLVARLLLGEELPARHRDDAHAHARSLERLARGERDVDLGAGREDDRVGLSLRRVGEDVAAAREPRGRREARPVEDGELLPREDEPDRAARAAESDPPRRDGLGGVRGAHAPEPRHRAERGEVLDRLVRRSVLAESDRVVRPDEDDGRLAESGEPHRGAHVVGEAEKRSNIGPHAAV